MKRFGEWARDYLVQPTEEQLDLDLCDKEALELKSSFDPVEYIHSLPCIWNLELLGFHCEVSPYNKDSVKITIGWGQHKATQVIQTKPYDLSINIQVENFVIDAIVDLYSRIVAESE